MHRLSLLLWGLLIAACAAPVAEVQGSYRKAGAPIYSIAVLDAARLEGRWVQVAGFDPGGTGECRPGGVDIRRTAAGLQAALRLCLSGAEIKASGALNAVGPGRFALAGASIPGLGEPWWVLWADTDYRTLIIGTPSGHFGFILNRDRVLPQDRLVAAREILDFNGYDLRQLQVYGRARR